MATIGTGGGYDYSTIDSWADAAPATSMGVYVGDLYNTAEWNETVTVSGKTVDASNYMHLRAASGQGFQDHAGVRTNPLRYDQAKGVGFSFDSTSVLLAIDMPSFSRFTGIQFRRTSIVSGDHSAIFRARASQLYDSCIIEQAFSGGTGGGSASVFYGAGAYPSFTTKNCLIYRRSTDSTVHPFRETIGIHHFTTFVSASGGGIMVSDSYVENTFHRCAIFGFSSISGVINTSDYVYTDLASPPAGATNVGSLTYTGQFENTSYGTHDYRLKVGADLIDISGANDATNGPDDISGLARPVNTNSDIGAWEYQAAGGGGGSTGAALHHWLQAMGAR